MLKSLVESLESRTHLAGVSIDVNFQPSGGPQPVGMAADTGAVFSEQGGFAFGWNTDNSTHVISQASSRSKSKSPEVGQTYALMQGRFGSRSWQLAVPNGTYRVHVIAADAGYGGGSVIDAEGHAVVAANSESMDGSRTVVVRDGAMTLTNGSPDGPNAIAFVSVRSYPTVIGGGSSDAAGVHINWPKTSDWKAAAGSPIARFESHAFSYDGKLYVMGGWADGDFNSTRRVDVFDPATNTWTRLKNMAAPETHAGAALDEADGVIYFVGGHRGKYPSTPSTEVWKYTIATDTWRQLPVRLPYAMGANTVQMVDGQLHSFGGNYADRVTNTPDHFVLDLSNLEAGFTKAAPLPSPRDHLSSVVIGGKIYAFGGEFGHDKTHDQQDLLQRYDPATDTWTELADAPVSKSHAESSSFVLNGKIIFAAGQIDPQKPSSGVFQYDPASNKWTTLASLPVARQGTIVQRVGDYFVYTTGGINTNQPQRKTWSVKIA